MVRQDLNALHVNSYRQIAKQFAADVVLAPKKKDRSETWVAALGGVVNNG